MNPRIRRIAQLKLKPSRVRHLEVAVSSDTTRARSNFVQVVTPNTGTVSISAAWHYEDRQAKSRTAGPRNPKLRMTTHDDELLSSSGRLCALSARVGAA